jgi:hypothetical protein
MPPAASDSHAAATCSVHINDTRNRSSWCRYISPSKGARALELGRWLGTPPPNLDRPAELDVSPLLQACRLHDAAPVVQANEPSRPSLPSLPSLPASSTGGRSSVPQTKKITPSSLPGIQAAWMARESPHSVSSLPKLCPQKLPATTVWPKNCGVALAQRSHPNNRVWGLVTHKRSQATSPRQVSPGPQKPGSAVGAPHRTLAN